MSTPRVYLCHRCKIDPLPDCPNCGWLNMLAVEAEERVEYLLRSATIDRWPTEPGEVFWLLFDRQRAKRESFPAAECPLPAVPAFLFPALSPRKGGAT